MNYKTTISTVTQDRAFIIAWVVLAILALLLVVMSALQITPSDLQIPVQYTSFGVTNFYRDRWYYLLGFVLFGAVLLVTHSVISLKLYQKKGREVALPFLWMSTGILVASSFIVFALFRVVSFSQ